MIKMLRIKPIPCDYLGKQVVDHLPENPLRRPAAPTVGIAKSSRRNTDKQAEKEVTSSRRGWPRQGLLAGPPLALRVHTVLTQGSGLYFSMRLAGLMSRWTSPAGMGVVQGLSHHQRRRLLLKAASKLR
jgi:hypothetical protein